MTNAAPEPATDAHGATEERSLPLDAVTAFAHELHDQFGIDPSRFQAECDDLTAKWLERGSQLVDLEAEVATLREEIAALRAGEDDTPADPMEVITPEQMLYRLNNMTGDERRQWMRDVGQWSETAYACTGRFNATHAGQLADMRIELDRALRKAHEMSARPTRHAYEAACEALERRRVALVSALQQPEEMAFDDAVAVAGRLAGGVE